MQFMLDTNVISDLINDPSGHVATQFRQVDEKELCCSVVVAAELRYGVAKKRSIKLKDRVEQFLQCIKILPLSAPVDRQYALLRLQLTLSGTIIGPNDLWIAAHALSENLVLVTDNVREFSRVNNLQIVNWRTVR